MLNTADVAMHEMIRRRKTASAVNSTVDLELLSLLCG
jgi:hypothetical protein